MTSRPALPLPVAVAGAVAIGALAAVQARINGLLGIRLGDGIAAGLVSFGVGTLVVAAIVFATPAGRAGLGRFVRGMRARSIPPWMLLGGACGALMVAAQGLTAGVVGVSLFTVGVVAGQTVHGLVLDRAGFGPGGVIAVTAGRLVGGILALAAVGISLSGDVLASTPLWMLVLPFVAGAGIAWQQGANGRLSHRIGSSVTATLVSFGVGAVVLALATIVSIGVGGVRGALPSEPHLYAGGAIGAVCVFLSVRLVAHTGVLVLGLGTVLGQLVTAVVIDLVWPTPASPAIGQLVAMVAVAAASVLAAAVRRRR